MIFAEINGVRFAYTSEPGKGAPVVLMHGWGCNHITLASVEKVVRTLGRPVINVDFPGFGESSEPTAVWGIEAYTAAFEELMRRCGVGENAVLLGHSFGGRVGILYASRNPVGKLILVDAAGVKPRRSLKYYLKVYTFKSKKQLLYLLFGRERAEEKLNKLRAKAGSSDYAGASPRMRQILSKVVNEDLCAEMPKIKAPTLLIWGEADTATPLADAKKMERLIPDAGLVSFPGAGHYSFLDCPGQFAAVLTSFLNS
ncbi:MAG: alpha/beta hydrolase [Bacteroides sp.]|nr:alpha/beta hydrolase [Bacteroides sp.]MCM1379138.1 alpha/beta hydrolase [Bacteroides sp.]MCM1445332.1 alpha/beta hydrolase [Prevotella sp.]